VFGHVTNTLGISDRSATVLLNDEGHVRRLVERKIARKANYYTLLRGN
jgi:hypothetical protein